MPLISIRLIAGRSGGELADLVQAVSAAAAESLDVPVDRIGVHLFELPPDRVARGGKLLLDPASPEAGDGP